MAAWAVSKLLFHARLYITALAAGAWHPAFSLDVVMSGAVSRFCECLPLLHFMHSQPRPEADAAGAGRAAFSLDVVGATVGATVYLAGGYGGRLHDRGPGLYPADMWMLPLPGPAGEVRLAFLFPGLAVSLGSVRKKM